jgi:hypothetical protein
MGERRGELGVQTLHGVALARKNHPFLHTPSHSMQNTLSRCIAQQNGYTQCLLGAIFAFGCCFEVSLS